MTLEHLRLIQQAADLQSAHRADELAMLYAQDGVFEDVPFHAVARSREEMKDFWQGTWTAMPDFTMTLVSAVADEQRGAAEWIMSATQTGSFQGLPATGKRFTLRAASMAKFADGRILHWADYWSLSSFKQQVGLE